MRLQLNFTCNMSTFPSPKINVVFDAALQAVNTSNLSLINIEFGEEVKWNLSLSSCQTYHILQKIVEYKIDYYI